MTRIEAELGVTLDVAALARAETPGDLLRTIRTAAPAPALAASVRDADPDSDDPRVDYPPDSLDTLPDVLDWHAEHHGERLLVTIESHSGAATQLSYARLRIDALAVAAGIVERDFGAGDAVALMLPTGSEFSPPSTAPSTPAACRCRCIRRRAWRYSKTTCNASPGSCATPKPGC